MSQRFAFVLVSSLFLAACGPAEPLKLGFIGGLSGQVADLGNAGRNGFQMAIEQANATGSVPGRKIEFVLKDDAQSAAQARQAAEELVAAGVVAIVGPMTSSMVPPILEVATKAKIPLVSPTATSSMLTGKDDNFLRVISDTRSYAEQSANYHAKNGVRSVAAVFDTRNRTYTESWLADFRQAFAAQGGAMAVEVAFESGENADYGGLVKTLAASRADAFLFIANAIDTARLAQHAREQDVQRALIGVEWAGTEQLIEFGGKAVDGMVLSQFFDREDRSPEYQLFRQSYEKRFNSPPGFASIAAYDATKAVLDALARGGVREELKSALISRGPYAGAQQAVVFDRFGDSQRRTFTTVIRDGRFVVVN
ncbi:MAG: ABC transporter substrate-binding protein [Zoogloeaceae bacterium]|nr:ABC transporter substrate-binding protein [Zoogloeaceae bacterium]